MGLHFWHLLAPYYNGQVAACHQWFLFEYSVVLEGGEDTIDKNVAELFVGHLAATLVNRDIYQS